MTVAQDPYAGKNLINYTTKNGVGIIELSNPPANTYSYTFFRQFDEAVLQARFDPEVWAILVTGSGDKFFSAGADIKYLQQVTPEYKYFFCLHANETLARLEQTPKITIAAINGHCVGGGLEIAMACDLRFARKDGGKIGLPEVNLGVLPGTGGTQRLVRILGKARAIEWMTTGANYTFEEAEQYGILNGLWEGTSEAFKAQAIEYARQFTPPNKASMSVGLIKRACQTGAELPLQDALALERELQQQLFKSEDAKEGINAYNEKRTPKFKGK
ncbi:MAG TPA: enoyl-CoA hydratase/isomerase family protein [Candidatus Thermoplasmatota archaeon]|jgi:enoyl-CoA hydratase/carnithine racemase|nr:enoyl-CoA hydratase/isomerase family protein [Candidatus Thermoplasmatota archaeon]